MADQANPFASESDDDLIAASNRLIELELNDLDSGDFIAASVSKSQRNQIDAELRRRGLLPA